MTLVFWLWFTLALSGVALFAALAREAWLTYLVAKKATEAHLLGARTIWRTTRSWLVAFIAFAVVGAASTSSSPFANMVTTIGLIGGIGQIVVAAWLSWRDQRKLNRIIEAEIRRRRKKG